mmetsp:Transcript_27209/g.108961  ORF Transcript_27209/g.108961 Transcript_27209/m.108961 type:complete len:198 (+) Transcript_27209:472-1065(+)
MSPHPVKNWNPAPIDDFSKAVLVPYCSFLCGACALVAPSWATDRPDRRRAVCLLARHYSPVVAPGRRAPSYCRRRPVPVYVLSSRVPLMRWCCLLDGQPPKPQNKHGLPSEEEEEEEVPSAAVLQNSAPSSSSALRLVVFVVGVAGLAVVFVTGSYWWLRSLGLGGETPHASFGPGDPALLDVETSLAMPISVDKEN